MYRLLHVYMMQRSEGCVIWESVRVRASVFPHILELLQLSTYRESAVRRLTTKTAVFSQEKTRC